MSHPRSRPNPKIAATEGKAGRTLGKALAATNLGSINVTTADTTPNSSVSTVVSVQAAAMSSMFAVENANEKITCVLKTNPKSPLTSASRFRLEHVPIHTQNQAGSTPASDDGPSVPLDVNKAQLATGSSRDKQVRQKCWMITDKAARTSDGTVYLNNVVESNQEAWKILVVKLEQLCDSNDPDAASHARADVHPSEEAKAVIPNTLVVLAVGTTGTGKSFALSGDIRIRKAPAHQQPVSPVPARQTGPADQLASNTSTLTATSAGTTTSPQIVFRSNWGMIPLTLAWLFDRHGHVYQETNEEATPFSVQMTMHEYRKGPVAGTNRSSENQQKRVLLSETFTREQDALMQFVKANGNRQTASRGDQIGQQVRSGESSRSWSVLIIRFGNLSIKFWDIPGQECANGNMVDSRYINKGYSLLQTHVKILRGEKYKGLSSEISMSQYQGVEALVDDCERGPLMVVLGCVNLGDPVKAHTAATLAMLRSFSGIRRKTVLEMSSLVSTASTPSTRDASASATTRTPPAVPAETGLESLYGSALHIESAMIQAAGVFQRLMALRDADKADGYI